jgi:hypothetical protein
MTRAIRRHIASICVFALVLQLGLSLPTLSGLVLCVGSDGHVAVESGGAGSCGPLAQQRAIGCEELGYAAPCSDTPLDGGAAVSAASLRAGDLDVPLASAPAFVLIPLPVTGASVHAHATSLAHSSRTHRSIILRL